MAILFLIYLFITLWTMYLAVMNLKRARDKGTLPNAAKCFGYPILIVGYVLDILFNLIVGTVLFLELPREFVFTSRLSRHLSSNGYKFKVAIWICKNLLDPFDPSGGHCKRKK